MTIEKTEIERELDELKTAADGSDFVPSGDADDKDKGTSKDKAADKSKDKADDKDADDKARDTKGRFAKGEKSDDDADAADDDADDAAGKKGAGKKAAGDKGKEDADKDAEGEELENEEETEEEEEDADDKDDKGSSNHRIRTLVDQRNKAREKAALLNARVTELEKAQKSTAKDDKAVAEEFETKIAGLYQEVEEARADNDTKKAAALQREIDKLNQQAIRAEAKADARQEAFAAQQNTTFDSMLEFLEEARPVLNPKHELFDEDVVKELNFQVTAYEKMGMTGPRALRRAAAMIFEVDPFAKQAPKAKEEKDEKAGKKDEKPADKKTDIKKNVEDSKKIPPKGDRSDKSTDGKKIQVKDLTDEEFDALPESKKKELGGDYL